MTALVIIVLLIAVVANLASGAATTYHYTQMGKQAYDENRKKHEKVLRENAKKANVYYNPVGRYYEHDKNYDGTPKNK